MYFMPQSGAGISRSGGGCANAARMRAATGLERFRLAVAHIDDAEDHGLVAESVEGLKIEVGLSGSR